MNAESNIVASEGWQLLNRAGYGLDSKPSVKSSIDVQIVKISKSSSGERVFRVGGADAESRQT